MPLNSLSIDPDSFASNPFYKFAKELLAAAAAAVVATGGIERRSLRIYYYCSCFFLHAPSIVRSFVLARAVFSFCLCLCVPNLNSRNSKQLFISQTVLTDLAKYRHFGKRVQVWQILMVYFLFGKMLSLLWQICDVIGLVFIVANGQIFINNLTIWSHCSQMTAVREIKVCKAELTFISFFVKCVNIFTRKN